MGCEFLPGWSNTLWPKKDARHDSPSQKTGDHQSLRLSFTAIVRRSREKGLHNLMCMLLPVFFLASDYYIETTSLFLPSSCYLWTLHVLKPVLLNFLWTDTISITRLLSPFRITRCAHLTICISFRRNERPFMKFYERLPDFLIASKRYPSSLLEIRQTYIFSIKYSISS